MGAKKFLSTLSSQFFSDKTLIYIDLLLQIYKIQNVQVSK